MADKVGSSSYMSGDCGGSAGDYHGVSAEWIRSKTMKGMRKASTERSTKFVQRVAKLDKGQNRDSNRSWNAKRIPGKVSVALKAQEDSSRNKLKRKSR